MTVGPDFGLILSRCFQFSFVFLLAFQSCVALRDIGGM